MREFIQGFFTVISDVNYQITQWVVQDDKVSHYSKVSGNFIDEFMGLPATGKSFSVSYAEFVTLKDGKIVYVWQMSDGVELARQASE